MNFLLGFVIFASLLHSQIALNNESINGRLMRISTNHETTSRDGRNTTNTRNDIVKDNRISGIGVDQSAILSIDPMRNLIVKKTIKSGKTNFFGFILIPCKSYLQWGNFFESDCLLNSTTAHLFFRSRHNLFLCSKRLLAFLSSNATASSAWNG